MTEISLNEREPISTANVTNADLEVDNGNIVDSNGNNVVIGNQIDEVERAFGKEFAGVTAVADGTPTGTLQTDGNGNIVVEGHGTVTLVGNRRRITTVGGTNGKSASIQTDNSGDLFIRFDETFTDIAINSSTVTGVTSGDGPITVSGSFPTDAQLISVGLNGEALSVDGDDQINVDVTVTAAWPDEVTESGTLSSGATRSGISFNRTKDFRGESGGVVFSFDSFPNDQKLDLTAEFETIHKDTVTKTSFISFFDP